MFNLGEQEETTNPLPIIYIYQQPHSPLNVIYRNSRFELNVVYVLSCFAQYYVLIDPSVTQYSQHLLIVFDLLRHLIWIDFLTILLHYIWLYRGVVVLALYRRVLSVT